LLGRNIPLVPTKEAGRGREVRGTAEAWWVAAFRGSATGLVLLGLRCWMGKAPPLGKECRLTEEVMLGVLGVVEGGGPCWTVGLT
jgi:hypothetical protein